MARDLQKLGVYKVLFYCLGKGLWCCIIFFSPLNSDILNLQDLLPRRGPAWRHIDDPSNLGKIENPNPNMVPLKVSTFLGFYQNAIFVFFLVSSCPFLDSPNPSAW